MSKETLRDKLRSRGWPSWLAILVAATVLCFDVIVSGGPSLSLLIGIPAVIAYFLKMGVLKLFKKEESAVKSAGVSSLMFTGIILVAIAVLGLNSFIAKGRAEAVVAAVEKYHADTGTWPKSLESVVPKYLESIPNARMCTDFSCKFIYLPAIEGKRGPSLMYVRVTPFGRQLYDFTERRWVNID